MQNTRNTFVASQIAEACGGQVVHGDPAAKAHGICTDTRKAAGGEAFFALVGENHDGHAFLPEATAAGTRVLVAERSLQQWIPPADVAVVQVEGTAAALLALAAWHRRRLGARIIAITGSYGKSTVKEMTAAILRRAGGVTAAPASYNNRIGVALTLLSAGPDDSFVVLEMGTNHPGEIAELAAAAKPDVGAITNIGQVHLEGLHDLHGVQAAKAELIPCISPTGALILNADNALTAALVNRFAGTVRTYGLGKGAQLRPNNVRRLRGGWGFEIDAQRFVLPMGGRYNVQNALAALSAADFLGVSTQEAAAALAAFQPPAMRYQRIDLGGVTFVCDCYNSNPPAVRATVGSFILEEAVGRKFIVCGDMLELGEDAQRLHRQLGADLALSGADLLVTVGPLARHMAKGWREDGAGRDATMSYDSPEQAWRPLWKLLRPGDWVLLKGSRGMHMETITARIADHLKKTGKEAAA